MGYFWISLQTRHRARRIDLGVSNGKIFASSFKIKIGDFVMIKCSATFCNLTF